jgi:hypothetical protein
MPYQVISDAMVAVLRKVPEFNLGVNVSQADYKILSGGFSQCIVLFPSSFTSEVSTLGGPDSNFWIDWEVRCELYIRYDGDSTAAANVVKFRDKIIEQIAKHPFLDDTDNILLAQVRRGDQPIPVFRPDGTGPFFWLQNIFIQVREEYSVDAVE